MPLPKLARKLTSFLVCLPVKSNLGIWKHQPAVEVLSTVFFQPALSFSTNSRPVFAPGELCFVLFVSREDKKKKSTADQLFKELIQTAASSFPKFKLVKSSPFSGAVVPLHQTLPSGGRTEMHAEHLKTRQSKKTLITDNRV